MDNTMVFLDSAMLGHNPGPNHPESSGRLTAVAAILENFKEYFHSPEVASREALARVHTRSHIEKILALRGQEASLDADTHVSSDSVQAALLAAGAGLCAIDAMVRGEASHAFCLVRPPGHHAESGRGMGFCLLNSVAIAAAHAKEAHGLKRILIVDWDVHHGNGTQEIFYDDPSVLFFSVHQSPLYPDSGAVEEVGSGEGLGYTVNVPLCAGTGDAAYLRIFERLLRPIADSYRPELVLVSAGFDAHRLDPLGGMELSSTGFAHLCQSVLSIADTHCDGKLVLMLEGGYNLQALAQSVLACTEVLVGQSAVPQPTATDPADDTAELARAMAFHGQYWPVLR